MLVIYEPDKKNKNTLDFLKVDIITIKMILHLVSLAKKPKLYMTCSKCAPWRWYHTWSCRAKLSITLTRSSLVIPWVCWVIATLSSAIVCGLFWYIWSFKNHKDSNLVNAVTILGCDICWSVDLQSDDPAIP